MAEEKQHPVVCFGESLWDILPEGRLLGGAPLNVAYHLKKSGKNPAVISRVGYDEAGSEILRILDKRSICTDYFQVDYTVPTGAVVAEIQTGNELKYDIQGNVAWDYIACEDSLAELVADADYFVFGSLAARSRRTRDTLFQLLSLAKTKVLDINLRPPFYDRDIIEQLLIRASILKLNLSELELITGWFSPFACIEDRIKIIRDRFELQTIILTKGGEGSVLNTGEEFYQYHGIPVTVKDTIGSGDAFLAGMLSKFMDKKSAEESLEFANRLAAFVTTKKGGCPEYEQTDILEFFR